MKNQLLIFFGLSIIMIISCTPIKVLSDVEEGTNFYAYKTFKLLNQKSKFPSDANPINGQRLEKAIVNKMKKLNYKESDNPDLLVTFFVKKETMQNQGIITDYYDEWDYVDKFNIYQYKVGTMVVDLIDAKKNQIVWHGILSRETDENINTAEERINRNVTKLFDRFEKERSR